MNQDKDMQYGETIVNLAGGARLRYQPLAQGLARLSFTKAPVFAEPLLNRYRFLKEDWPPVAACLTEDSEVSLIQAGGLSVAINRISGRIGIAGQAGLDLEPEPGNAGFLLTIPLLPGERLFGLGDESRESIMKRGRRAVIWAENVKSYIPVPFLLSSRGWAVLVNTTFKHEYDLGATDPDRLTIRATEGPFDIYLFFAQSMPGLIDLYTQLSGRPAMLPKYAFGYMFIVNEENNARAMLDDARNFRLNGIPCDCIGLEPDWMEKHYDYSVNKKWHPTKFYIPYWIRDMKPHHPITFFGALHRLGFRLSLWLCCDYDLLWEEEKRSAENVKAVWDQDSAIIDDHFNEDVRLDKLTVSGQPWFEHLKQFVHQGVSAFKLDAANFIMGHPDRVWADKYRDNEVHNLLPLVYGRQMSQGYADFTGERAMINIPMGYAGIQHYCATWAGDTGGGAKPLISMLNLGHCGISSTSCDIEVTDARSIHFGFLQAWTQQNNWNYWLQPWLLGEALEETVRFYARLRSQLFPYLYAYAHVAANTGMPLMRSLSLSWPDTDAYDQVLNQYMLGDALLVTAFTDQAILPAGIWTDFWTDRQLEGGRSVAYNPPAGRGGGLFARAGSLVVMQPWAPSLEQFQPDCLDLHVYPGGNAQLDLVEDDGKTEQYRDGQIAVTPIRLHQADDGRHQLQIGRRTGSYAGMGPATAFQIIIHGLLKPAGLDRQGAALCSDIRDSQVAYRVSAEQHEREDLTFSW